MTTFFLGYFLKGYLNGKYGVKAKRRKTRLPDPDGGLLQVKSIRLAVKAIQNWVISTGGVSTLCSTLCPRRDKSQKSLYVHILRKPIQFYVYNEEYRPTPRALITELSMQIFITYTCTLYRVSQYTYKLLIPLLINR